MRSVEVTGETPRRSGNHRATTGNSDRPSVTAGLPEPVEGDVDATGVDWGARLGPRLPAHHWCGAEERTVLQVSVRITVLRATPPLLPDGPRTRVVPVLVAEGQVPRPPRRGALTGIAHRPVVVTRPRTPARGREEGRGGASGRSSPWGCRPRVVGGRRSPLTPGTCPSRVGRLEDVDNDLRPHLPRRVETAKSVDRGREEKVGAAKRWCSWTSYRGRGSRRVLSAQSATGTRCALTTDRCRVKENPLSHPETRGRRGPRTGESKARVDLWDSSEPCPEGVVGGRTPFRCPTRSPGRWVQGSPRVFHVLDHPQLPDTKIPVSAKVFLTGF